MELNEINWRSGTLRRYESLSCIGAKFCYLNRVEPIEFLRFLATYLRPPPSPIFQDHQENQQAKWIAKFIHATHNPHPTSVFSVLGLPRFRLTAFARALGEHTRLLTHSNYQRMLPQSIVQGVCDVDPLHLIAAVRYCPDCLAAGYHGTFHQLPWFDRCLLHGSPIIDIARSAQHNHRPCCGEFKLPEGDGDLVSDLYRLMFGAQSPWNFSSPQAWEPAEPRDVYRAVEKYTQWIQQVKKSAAFDTLQGVLFYDFSRAPMANRTADFFRCAHDIHPAPETVMRCLRPTHIVHRSTVTCTQLDGSGLGPAIKTAFDKRSSFFIKNLVDIRMVSCELLNEPTSWSTIVAKATFAMLENHKQCEKTLKHITENGLVGYLTDKYPSFKRVCPRIALANEYNEMWYKNISHGLTSHQEALRLLVNNQSLAGNELEQLNLAERFDAEVSLTHPAKHTRVYRTSGWKLAAPLAQLCDALLNCMAIGSNWDLYQIESHKVLRLEDRRDGYSLPLTRIVVSRDGMITMQLWWRSENLLPDWHTLDNNCEEHVQNVHAWDVVAHKTLAEGLIRYHAVWDKLLGF